MDKTVLEGKVRNIDIEEYAIDMIVKKTAGYISQKEIKDILIKNHFSGVYVLTSEEFHEVEDDQNAVGLYNHKWHVILLDEEAFAKQPNIAIHEMIHAYISDRGCRKVQVDSAEVNYGNGLEEGFAALLQMSDDINNINQCKVNSYPYQANIFKQLNALYEYSDSKKYPSLMHHMLKEPEDFLHAISEIYSSILRKFTDDSEYISFMSMKTAFAVVSSTDAMIRLKCNDPINIYRIIGSFNTIYLALADKRMRDGVENHELFPDLHLIIKSSEERLLGCIFNDESNYILKQLSKLDLLMTMYTEEMELLEVDDERKNAKVKSR